MYKIDASVIAKLKLSVMVNKMAKISENV